MWRCIWAVERLSEGGREFVDGESGGLLVLEGEPFSATVEEVEGVGGGGSKGGFG